MWLPILSWLQKTIRNWRELGERGIPKGSGPYSVGLTELITENYCGLSACVFYPISKDDEDINKQYSWLPRIEYAYGFAGFGGLSPRIFGPLVNWLLKHYCIPATQNAPLLSPEISSKFPIIVFSHGLGGTKQCYATVCTEMASHGFIVAAVEHRDGSASFTYCLKNYFADTGDYVVRESDVDTGFAYNFHINKHRSDERCVNDYSPADNSTCLPFYEVGTNVDTGKVLIRSYESKLAVHISPTGRQQLLQDKNMNTQEDNGMHRSPSCCSDHSFLVEQLIPFKIASKGEDEFILRNKQVHQRGDQCVQLLDTLFKLHIGQPIFSIVNSDFDWLQFQGRFDLNRICVMGHSFGGGTAVCALAKDKRFQCAVALDAWMHPLEHDIYLKIHQPVLFINTEKFQWPSNVSKMKKMERSSVDRRVVFLRGTVHQSQGDFPFLLHPFFGNILEVRGNLEPKAAMQLSNQMSIAFLRKHLDIEDPTDWWQLLEGCDERVIIGTNAPLRRMSVTPRGLNL